MSDLDDSAESGTGVLKRAQLRFSIIIFCRQTGGNRELDWGDEGDPGDDGSVWEVQHHM